MNNLMQSLQGNALMMSAEELTKCNERTARFGLVLQEQQMMRIEQHHMESLQHTGRIELGKGILKKLILAFCDSPYVEQCSYEETLCELQDLFYQFKTLTREQLTDDELLTAMRLIYDEAAGGSLEYLSGIDADTLEQVGRTGSFYGTVLYEKREEPSYEEWE